jgi:hypothetical protein
MISSAKAPVRPRVLSPATGQFLLLEDEVRDLMASRKGGLLRLVGVEGSGKTTALQHLAHVLAGTGNIHFVDDATAENLAPLTPAHGHWVVFTTAFRPEHYGQDWQLAPWREDEWIEYLLAEHRDRCASVMTRLRSAAQSDVFAGNPELWRIALDQMAAHVTIPSACEALKHFLDERLVDPSLQAIARSAAWHLLLNATAGYPFLLDMQDWKHLQQAAALVFRLLRHYPVRVFLAAAQILRPAVTTIMAYRAGRTSNEQPSGERC